MIKRFIDAYNAGYNDGVDYVKPPTEITGFIAKILYKMGYENGFYTECERMTWDY